MGKGGSGEMREEEREREGEGFLQMRTPKTFKQWLSP